METQRLSAVVGALVLISASVTTLSAQSADPALGTWKENVAKSTYSLGPPAKSRTDEITAWGDDGKTVIQDGIDAQDKPIHTEINYKVDGEGYSLKGAAQPNTTRTFKRFIDGSYEFLTKVRGKLTTTTRIVLAPDGKSRTITTTGMNNQGKIGHDVVVWDRQ